MWSSALYTTCAGQLPRSDTVGDQDRSLCLMVMDAVMVRVSIAISGKDLAQTRNRLFFGTHAKH